MPLVLKLPAVGLDEPAETLDAAVDEDFLVGGRIRVHEERKEGRCPLSDLEMLVV